MLRAGRSARVDNISSKVLSPTTFQAWLALAPDPGRSLVCGFVGLTWPSEAVKHWSMADDRHIMLVSDAPSPVKGDDRAGAQAECWAKVTGGKVEANAKIWGWASGCSLGRSLLSTALDWRALKSTGGSPATAVPALMKSSLMSLVGACIHGCLNSTNKHHLQTFKRVRGQYGSKVPTDGFWKSSYAVPTECTWREATASFTGLGEQ